MCFFANKYKYMSKGIRKSDNYFERVKQRVNRTNYRYYFFDYLYYKGESWVTRMSGFTLLLHYWSWIVILPGDIILSDSSLSSWRLVHICFMYLIIIAFILLRYRKARVQALMDHYRHLKRVGKIESIFLFLLPLALFFLELWLLGKFGLADTIKCNLNI